ncbi:outer membrane beta-barrel protein [Pareuzebyella sediminis]|uniref:outer membrane beta-barrel protein n=1 Tax=Pareuzebyella sediminis TaxID=2607998 RepID=UPI0011ED9260|nr:outer membrane beta-barrel protein [Pareuzebyella sediminis]
MPRFLLASFFSLIFCTISWSQEFKITGSVVDATSKQPLEATTVYAESLKDSALVAYTITNNTGFFELQDRTGLKELNIYFSYNGYKTLKMKIDLKPTVNLGTVQLEEQAEELEEVNVVGERVPITVKKDTLEFNADSFKTRPDATVEDVLKKLPGVEVDSDGNITVNGKEVSQVKVNGQVFFSTDPKVATKSLPKEIISKIQISDTKTRAQEFSGEAGNGESKTINLTLKEDKNKGYVGRVGAGYGTEDRYQANGLLNYFNDKERVSILASANNINNTGFSFDEIRDMMGGVRGNSSWSSNGSFSVNGISFGFGEGITTSSTLGASYANEIKNRFKINSNYFFSDSESVNNEKTTRENILPDRRFFTDNTSDFLGNTTSHQGSFQMDYDIDKTLKIFINPSLSVNSANQTRSNETETSDEAGNLVNRNDRIDRNNSTQRRFSNRFDVMKKLDTMGRLLRFSFSNENTENRSEGILNSEQEVFGEETTVELFDQQTEVKGADDNYRIELSYTHPLTKKLLLTAEYNFSDKTVKNKRDVFELDRNTERYTMFNEDLSSQFELGTMQNSPTLGIRHQGEKLNASISSRYMITRLEGTELFRNVDLSRKYHTWLYNGYLNYNFGNNKRLGLYFNSDLDIPSFSQLQPVAIINDPLNIIVGNPNLEPGVNRNIYLNYNNFNWRERTGFFIYSGVNFRKNRVSSVTTTDDNFIRTTTYRNVDGNYSAYSGMEYSKQIKKDSAYTLKFSIRPYMNLNRVVGISNGVELVSKNFTVNPRVRITFNYKELFEIEPEYTFSVNNTTFSNPNIGDVDFISHRLGLRTTTYWPENLIWENDISYNYNGNVGPGFDKSSIFWNTSIGMEVLKKKATLKISAFDLLNQNINTRRTTGEDFIQDFQGTVLRRYFMGSFTYKFDQFGGKKGLGNRFRR